MDLVALHRKHFETFPWLSVPAFLSLVLSFNQASLLIGGQWLPIVLGHRGPLGTEDKESSDSARQPPPQASPQHSAWLPCAEHASLFPQQGSPCSLLSPNMPVRKVISWPVFLRIWSQLKYPFLHDCSFQSSPSLPAHDLFCFIVFLALHHYEFLLCLFVAYPAYQQVKSMRRETLAFVYLHLYCPLYRLSQVFVG